LQIVANLHTANRAIQIGRLLIGKSGEIGAAGAGKNIPSNNEKWRTGGWRPLCRLCPNSSPRSDRNRSQSSYRPTQGAATELSPPCQPQKLARDQRGNRSHEGRDFVQKSPQKSTTL
jgi:hypothetical protein